MVTPDNKSLSSLYEKQSYLFLRSTEQAKGSLFSRTVLCGNPETRAIFRECDAGMQRHRFCLCVVGVGSCLYLSLKVQLPAAVQHARDKEDVAFANALITGERRAVVTQRGKLGRKIRQPPRNISRRSSGISCTHRRENKGAHHLHLHLAAAASRGVSRGTPGVSTGRLIYAVHAHVNFCRFFY